MENKINEEDELERLIEQVVKGRRSGFKVTWSTTDLSLELIFGHLGDQPPTEACRIGAAFALRALIEEARSERIAGFTAFWDGSEVTNVETTVVLPHPLKFLRLTISVA